MTMPRARTSPAARSRRARSNRPPRHRAVSISCVAPQRGGCFRIIRHGTSGRLSYAGGACLGRRQLSEPHYPIHLGSRERCASSSRCEVDRRINTCHGAQPLFRARQMRVECLPHLRGSFACVRQTLEVENRGDVRERDPGRQTERRRALTLAVQISQKRLQLRPMAPPTHRTRRAPRLAAMPGR